MRQTVTITRIADRHADLHEREFAETQAVSVPAGEIEAALARVCKLDVPVGAYTITVGWPYDTEEKTK